VTRPSSFEASRFAGFRSLTSRINRADPASRICPVRISSAAERRGLLTGPAYVNVDVSIVKILRFGQRRLEVRADMFNALNIPHYANPNGDTRQRELRTHHGDHRPDRTADPLRRALPVPEGETPRAAGGYIPRGESLPVARPFLLSGGRPRLRTCVRSAVAAKVGHILSAQI